MEKKKNPYIFISSMFILFACLLSLKIELCAEEISDDTVVVFEAIDFHKALNSETVTTIYLGKDITLTSDTVSDYTINAKKSFLIIDGTNPYAEHESDKAVIHTLTDRDGANEDGAMRLRDDGNLKNVTLQNLDIIGRNHYGIVYVTTYGVSLYYENITYSGPQLTHNKNGSAKYYNCDVTLRKNGVSATGEMAEAASVLLEGNINIDKSYGGADEIFWINYSAYLGSSFEIAPNANVNIIHDQTADGGLLYSGQAGYPIVIGKNAKLSFRGYQFVVENATPGKFEVQEGAEVSITLKRTGLRAALYTDSFSVGKDAVFHMEAGPSTETYPLLGITNGGSAVFNEPRSVLLKMQSTSAAAYLIKSTGASPSMSIVTEQLNYWTENSNGDLDILPGYHWQKRSGNLTVQAKLSDLGKYSNIETNYNLAEDGHLQSWLNEDNLIESTFDGSKVRILSMGTLPLTAEFGSRPEKSIRGKTKGNSLIKAKAIRFGNEVTQTVEAASAGDYQIPVEGMWQEGEGYVVLANNRYLYQQSVIDAFSSGYQITYDGNGQSEGEPPEDSDFYAEGTNAAVKGKYTLEKEGYQFAGWSTEPDGSGSFYEEGDEVLMGKDMTLYAVWKKLYMLTYDANSEEQGQYIDENGPFVAGEEIELAGIDEIGFVKKGYKFAGWGINKDTKPSEILESPLLMPERDIILYAVWVKKTTPFSFTKVNESNHDDYLTGVEFALYQYDDAGDEWVLFAETASDDNGVVSFKGLEDAEYRLVETSTNPNYQLPVGNWIITIDVEKAPVYVIKAEGQILPPGFLEIEGELMLVNERSIRLPLTGGRMVWVLLGIVTVLSTAITGWFFIKVKKYPMN